MNTHLHHVATPSPTPHETWKNMQDDARLSLVRSILKEHCVSHGTNIVVTSTKHDGQVICEFIEPVSANRRGSILLDFE